MFTVKQIRVGLNLTQNQMAKRLEIHGQTYAKLEKFPQKMTIEMARKFSEVTGTSIEDIFFG